MFGVMFFCRLHGFQTVFEQRTDSKTLNLFAVCGPVAIIGLGNHNFKKAVVVYVSPSVFQIFVCEPINCSKHLRSHPGDSTTHTVLILFGGMQVAAAQAYGTII